MLSVPFASGSWCCEPTSCNQRTSPFKWNTIVRHQQQNKSIREIAGTFGQINSLVHSEKKRTHWWAQQHKKAWTSTEDNSGGWSEDPLHGEEKPIHNIQPREEHSPGGRRVYNQEKTSPEQIQRWWSEDPLSFTTSSQEKNTLQEVDVSTIKRRLHQSKYRGDDRRILSLSQHPAKRRTLSRR